MECILKLMANYGFNGSISSTPPLFAKAHSRHVVLSCLLVDHTTVNTVLGDKVELEEKLLRF